MAVRTSQQLQQLFQKSKEEKEKQALERKELKKIKNRENQKKYRETHREEIKLSQALYRAKNKEKLNAYQAEYRQKEENRLKSIQYQEQYRKKRKDLLKPTDEEVTLQPPVKTKKQVKEIYQKWLKNLQDKQPYLTGFKLYCNQLMQKSLENELFMGRRKLTIQEIKDKYQTMTDNYASLKQKRKQSQTNEEIKEINEQLEKVKILVYNFKSRYSRELKEEKTPAEKINEHIIINSKKQQTLQNIEQKAKELLNSTTDPKERKSIEERLYYTRLRYKYAFI